MVPAKKRPDATRLIPRIDALGFASTMLVVLFVLMLPYLAISPDAHNYADGVDLPKVLHPVSMPGARREDAISIAITRDGKVYLGNEQVELSELLPKVNEMLNSGSPKVAYFKVDGRARYLYVSDVLDSVRLSGLEKIAFIAEEEKTQDRAN